jgi:hypothetical protein
VLPETESALICKAGEAAQEYGNVSLQGPLRSQLQMPAMNIHLLMGMGNLTLLRALEYQSFPRRLVR